MFKDSLIQIAFLIAITATAGSLFFSEVMKLPPCILCWYQRIFMYPLVFIFAVGLFRKSKDTYIHGAVLSCVGLLIAIYHNLLYYKLIPENITPCTTGVSCTSKQIEWLGFVTIPFLSLVAFTFLFSICIYILKQKDNQT